MTFLYTAVERFNTTSTELPKDWNGYTQFSGLTHPNEIISLDILLNKSLVEPDYNNGDDWNYFHSHNGILSNLYTSIDYVLRRSKGGGDFNLLAVVIEPAQDCREAGPPDFEWIGYDLIDPETGISALTNCGGFPETFSPADQNKYGLVSDCAQAFDICKRLRENNPDEPHAYTQVMAIWRHKTLGR